MQIDQAAIEKIADSILKVIEKKLSENNTKVVGNALKNHKVDGDHIVRESIGNVHIKDAAIDTAKIKDLTAEIARIAVAEIGTAIIDVAQIDQLSATVANIVQATIQNADIEWADIANLTATIAAIAVANIETARINFAQIDGLVAGVALIQEVVGGKVQIADLSVSDANIVTLNANKIKAGTLSVERLVIVGSTQSIVYAVNEANGTAQLSQTTIDGGSITEKTITADQIIAHGITADCLNVAEIFANEALIGAITTSNIAAGTITAASAIIADGAITTAKIGDAQITSAKIADANITTAKIGDAQITGAKIADATITNANIAEATINSANIGDGQITTAKIGDAQITNAKINDLNASKINAGTLSADRIAAGSITTDKLGASAITADKLAADAVEARHISAGAITTSKLASDVGSSLDISSNASITSKVSQTTYDSGIAEVQAKADEAQASVDAIKIGGRNLALDSGTVYTNNVYNVSNYWITPGEGGVLSNNRGYLVPGETYTMSICVTPSAQLSSLQSYLSSGNWRQCVLYTDGTVNKQTLSATFTAKYYPGKSPSDDNEHAKVIIYRLPNVSGVTYDNTTIHWIKIERGNKATDWTPAPEDTKADIDSLVSRVSSAEEKIEPDAIIHTVTQSETYQSGLSNTEQTAITQSKDAINLAVGSISGNPNLLLKSDFTGYSSINGWVGNGDYITLDSTKLYGGHNTVKISRSGLAENAYTGISQTLVSGLWKPGDTVTLSCWYYCDALPDQTAVLQMRVKASDGSYTYPNVKIGTGGYTEVGAWTRAKLTLEIPAGTTELNAAYQVQRNGTIWIAEPKLEKGAIATGWCLADIEFVNGSTARFDKDGLKITQTGKGTYFKADADDCGFYDANGNQLAGVGVENGTGYFAATELTNKNLYENLKVRIGSTNLLAEASTEYGLEFVLNTLNFGGIFASYSGGFLGIATPEPYNLDLIGISARISLGMDPELESTDRITITGDVVPDINNTYQLGTSAIRWEKIYSNNALNGSDRRIKNSIVDIVRAKDFVLALRPRAYKLNGDDDGKTHLGFIAQEVKEAMDKSGQAAFGGYDDTDPDALCLGYNEFIAPLVALVQAQEKRIAALEERIAVLEEYLLHDR